MALEEELMTVEEAEKKEEVTKNPDDLTDEEIDAVKELILMP